GRRQGEPRRDDRRLSRGEAERRRLGQGGGDSRGRRRRRASDDGAGGRQGPREASGSARLGVGVDQGHALVKVLALDYGSARTGVAVSDATGTIARPLCVVERAATPDGLERLAALIAAEGAERVVVGMPLTMRGERGEQALETERFVDELRRSTTRPI